MQQNTLTRKDPAGTLLYEARLPDGPASKEVILAKYDRGWHRDMAVTLYTYDDGTQELHRQTGLQYREHIAEAAELLKARGLAVGPFEGDIWPTGIYLRVTPIAPEQPRLS